MRPSDVHLLRGALERMEATVAEAYAPPEAITICFGCEDGGRRPTDTRGTPIEVFPGGVDYSLESTPQISYGERNADQADAAEHQRLTGSRWLWSWRSASAPCGLVAAYRTIGNMLLTISTTHRPATDLGYLLHKNPGRYQSFTLPFGRADVFYPVA